MELERIFILSNMSCNVSYETSCMFVCNLHWDTSSLCHERMKFDIYVRRNIMRDFSVRVHGSRVEKYHTSNPTQNRKAPKASLQKLGPTHMLHVFASLTPIVG